MAEISGFHNSKNGDRRVKSDFFARFFGSLIGNGIFTNPSTGLQVMANGDMSVTVKAGKAWINGVFYENTADMILSLDVADGVLKRIDRVMLQYSTIERTIAAKVKKGTFASSPVAPMLQRDADVWELGIADILVNNGIVSISQANINDLRLNTSLCGIVHGLVDQVDTETIFNQYFAWFEETKQKGEADFNAFLTDLQNTLSGDVAGNLLNKINANTVDISELQKFQTAAGSATAITLSNVEFVDGFQTTFVIANSNSGSATTINGKRLYKPGTTTAPKLVAGKATTVWYTSTGGCFFIKASAEGTAIAGDVLASKTFSNDDDAGLTGMLTLTGTVTAADVLAPKTAYNTDPKNAIIGTMTNNGAVTITPSGIDQAILAGYHSGLGKVNALTLQAGDILWHSNDAQFTFSSATYYKCKETSISGIGGAVRVKFTLSYVSGYEATARIYKNGVAVGMIRTVNTGTYIDTVFAEDITIVSGDLIQIYAFSTSGAVQVKNLRLYIQNTKLGTYADNK